MHPAANAQSKITPLGETCAAPIAPSKPYPAIAEYLSHGSRTFLENHRQADQPATKDPLHIR
jgi:hypothetical protein